MPWPPTVREALSSSCVSMMQAVLPPGCSNDEEPEECEHDIHTMRGELAVARQALQDGCREVEWLKECLVTDEIALDAIDGEAADARAADTATHAELTGELNFFCFVELFSALELL